MPVKPCSLVCVAARRRALSSIFTVMRDADKAVSTSREAELPAALPASRITVKMLDKARRRAATQTNEHGVTDMRLADSKPAEGYYPIFLHTLYAGLVPPFSPFLMAVLETYQIQLLHLHPNSILILSIFTYLCEDRKSVV